MVHRAKSERLSVIVLHSRLFDMEHRLLLRIFLHEEETGSSKRPQKNLTTFDFLAVVRIHRTSSGAKKARTDSQRGPTWFCFG